MKARWAIRWIGLAPLLALAAAGCGSRDPDLLMERGVRAYTAGRYKAAARALSRAVRIEPRHPMAQLWCGVAHWKAGQAKRAAVHFMAAAAMDPDNPLPLEYAALAYAGEGEWLEAGKRLNEAFRLAPDSPRVLNAMGVASAMRDSPSASSAQLAQALRLSPHYPPALYNAAVLARDWMGRPAEARRLFQRYLDLAPDGERAEEARKALNALEPATGPASAPAPARNAAWRGGGDRAADLVRQAQTAVRRRDYDEAAARYREAAAAAPADPEPRWALARLLEEKTPQAAEALESYRAFLRDFADDPRAETARARINDLAARQPSRVSPAAPPPRALAGELDFRKPEIRNRDAAFQAIRRGAQYHVQQDWDRALFYFKRAIELDDRLPEAYWNLGLVYWHLRDDEHARPLFQAALARRSDWPEARIMLARVYRRQKLAIKAVEHLREIVKTTPDYADAYYELGSLFRGEAAARDQARGWFARYLQLAPGGAHAFEVNAWLAANP